MREKDFNENNPIFEKISPKMSLFEQSTTRWYLQHFMVWYEFRDKAEFYDKYTLPKQYAEVIIQRLRDLRKSFMRRDYLVEGGEVSEFMIRID